MTAPPTEATSISVLSFNMRRGLGVDEISDLRRTVQIIGASDVDVAALQEVDRNFGSRSDHRDQAWELGGELEMTAVFGPDTLLPPPFAGAPSREYGNATLSRKRVGAWDHVQLPGWPGMEPRGVLRATVSAGSSEVEVWNVHLAHEDPRLRLIQAEALVRALETRTHPVILCGDLNSEPGSAEHAILAGALADCTAELDRKSAGTYDSVTRRLWIDYVMSTPDLVATSVTIVDPGLASDHFGIRAEFQVSTSQPTAP